MGPQAVIANLGMLLYCAEHGAKRLTREDIEGNEKAKRLLKYGMDSTRYAFTGQGIALMVTDAGARAAHLKKKILKMWMQRKKHPEWQALMEQGAFSIVVITGSYGKARRLCVMMARYKDIAFDVVVFPELNDLGHVGEE
jgi:hypothetical protein